MRDEPGEEGYCRWEQGYRPAPILPAGVLLGNEVIGVVERHEHHDQATQEINRQKPI